MGSDAARQTTAASAPARATNPLTRIADARSWAALLVVALLAALSVVRWPFLVWIWGSLTLLSFLRAGALVLSARAAGVDPEEGKTAKGRADAAPPDHKP